MTFRDIRTVRRMTVIHRIRKKRQKDLITVRMEKAIRTGMTLEEEARSRFLMETGILEICSVTLDFKQQMPWENPWHFLKLCLYKKQMYVSITYYGFSMRQ